MFLECLNDIFYVAFYAVATKYPELIKDKKYRKTVFDVIEMLCDDIANRNIDIFIKRYIDQLAVI